MYTTQKSDSYGNVLLRNGHELFCPYQPALAIPGQNSFGQMQINIQRMPCCTNCPFAELIDEWITESNTWERTYVTKCTGTNVDFDIDGNVNNQELNETKLIIE
jgi:hypothetical protein